LGIRVSTKYAIVAASLEIAVMTTLAFLFIQSTHFYFYNPFSVHINFSKLAFAILFGSSIPTGYGSITPISGEAKNARKTISRAIITVILLGGLLAAFDVYAIGDHLVYFHLISNVTKIDILNLIKDRLGIVTLVFVLFASINDGILGALAFLTATSRTIFAMSSVGFLPKFLSKFENHKGPTRAVALSSILYIMLTALMLYIVKAPFLAFEILGAIAVLSSLFVHLSSNFSLVRISLKKINKRKLQISIGLIASVFSFFILIYSMEQASPIEVYVFMTWIIIGFLLAEIFSMIEEENEEED
ncbi:amino acid permease, partial [Sulfolobus sp. A20-N-F8]